MARDVDGDPAAAMRYTESRLARPALALAEDIDLDTVDFQDNYDGKEHEPVVLPARFPNLLVNGAGGIAVGMATNIPPHNLGEVIDATTHLFSRALILNNVGVPTTLTVLANEYLNVSYQVQIYNPTVDTTGTVVVAGTTCNYTMRAAYAGDPGYWGFGGFNSYPKPFGLAGCNVFNDVALQPILSGPIGTSQGTQDSVAVAGYTAGTYYVDGTATFGFGKCNGGANNSALCTFGNAYGGMGAAQIIFGTTIPKTGTQVMTLTFRQTWARYP